MPQIVGRSGKYALLSSLAKMPSSCWGKYRYCAIVHLEDGFEPEDVTMISDRAWAVKSIVWSSEASCVGKADRSAFARALAEGKDRLAKLGS